MLNAFCILGSISFYERQQVLHSFVKFISAKCLELCTPEYELRTPSHFAIEWHCRFLWSGLTLRLFVQALDDTSKLSRCGRVRGVAMHRVDDFKICSMVALVKSISLLFCNAFIPSLVLAWMCHHKTRVDCIASLLSSNKNNLAISVYHSDIYKTTIIRKPISYDCGFPSCEEIFGWQLRNYSFRYLHLDPWNYMIGNDK